MKSKSQKTHSVEKSIKYLVLRIMEILKCVMQHTTLHQSYYLGLFIYTKKFLERKTRGNNRSECVGKDGGRSSKWFPNVSSPKTAYDEMIESGKIPVRTKKRLIKVFGVVVPAQLQKLITPRSNRSDII